MGRFGSTKNFGYGRNLRYAGFHALRQSFRGKYATVDAHNKHWQRFVAWLKDEGIKDAQRITTEHLAQYAGQLGEYVSGGVMAVSYAQNLVSSVNVTLSVMRGDNAVRVSPSKAIGAQRNNVRTTPPFSMDREKVSRTIVDLRYHGWMRQAVILEVARDLGLRAREAVMMDYRTAIQEATKTGKVNVTGGTKGGRGRYVDRLVPVSHRAMQTLQRAAELQKAIGGRNLITPGKTQIATLYSLYPKAVRTIMTNHGLKMYHDARAAYACARYHQITSHPAPAVAGHRSAAKTTDKAARHIISSELGHGRTDVLASYVGTAR